MKAVLTAGYKGLLHTEIVKIKSMLLLNLMLSYLILFHQRTLKRSSTTSGSATLSLEHYNRVCVQSSNRSGTTGIRQHLVNGKTHKRMDWISSMPNPA